jgi:hypothetical protein
MLTGSAPAIGLTLFQLQGRARVPNLARDAGSTGLFALLLERVE